MDNDKPHRITISVKRTCEMLDISRSTCFALLRENAFESVLLKSKRLIFVDSINRHLENKLKPQA